MSTKKCVAFSALAGVLLMTTAQAGELTDSLQTGTLELQSAGPLAFGPEGILFIADTQGAAVYAVATGDVSATSSSSRLTVEGLGEKIASLLGTTSGQILVNDLAVNPASGKAYLSVSRGRGPDAVPIIVRVDHRGQLEEFSLENVKFARAALPNAPEAGAQRRGRKLRQESITDLAYADGRLFIAGLSNEEFASKLRSIPFPFTEADRGTSVEIYHGSHGRFETASPVRTFVPYDIAGQPHLLAAYTCTPLVKFPISQLEPGKRLMGTTVAELGNGNRPLDMIVYEKAGKKYLMLANSRRGVMKITTDNLDRAEGIVEKVADTAGNSYETIADLKGVEQLDRLNDESALVLVRAENGQLSLQTVALP